MVPEVFSFVKCEVDRRGLKDGKTLDVGSRHINGSVRELFFDYIGVDMIDGLNVDIVANAHALPFRDGTFDTVCCLEMLEHDDDFFKSISECHRVLKKGGVFLLTARGNGYERHDFPHDYWRFTDDSFNLLLSIFSTHSVAEQKMGVYGWGVK